MHCGGFYPFLICCMITAGLQNFLLYFTSIFITVYFEDKRRTFCVSLVVLSVIV